MKYTPVKLSPAYKDYLWGGEKLRTHYGKNTTLSPLAESWELSAHRDGESTVLGGIYNGMRFTEYLSAIGKEALGTKADAFDYFPLLIKFIDAKGDLSVQVHPDDLYAKIHEGEYGKTEMWYILDAEEDAAIYYGFKRTVTKDEYAAAIQSETLTELLSRVPVKKGDVFFIPAGTVHAIGKGIVICEIQQNSNTTYRVYDYGRRDKDGNLRPLHIEKALAVSTLTPACAPYHPETPNALLASCNYFTVSRLCVSGDTSLQTDQSSFRTLVVIEGEGTVSVDGETVFVRKGETVFFPAAEKVITLSGDFESIIASL